MTYDELFEIQEKHISNSSRNKSAFHVFAQIHLLLTDFKREVGYP